MKQPSWNQYEVALLIDAYMNIDKHPEKRKDVVIELSQLLRDIAISQGRKIDKTYRNTNGINLRLMELRFLFSNGKRGIANTSKLFASMVELFETERDQFNVILNEAKSGGRSTSDGSSRTHKEDNQEEPYRKADVLAEKNEPSSDINRDASAKTGELEDASQTLFYNWLSQHELLAGPTCRSYVSGIRSSERFAKEHGYNQWKLFVDGQVSHKQEAIDTIKSLLNDTTFMKIHAPYKTYLHRYWTFLDSEHGNDSTASVNEILEKESGNKRNADVAQKIDLLIKQSINGIDTHILFEYFPEQPKHTVLRLIAQNKDAIPVADKVYSRNNIDDFDHMADTLLEIIEKQFFQFGDYTSDVQLYKEAKSRLDDFFFFNGAFDSKVEVYDLAAYLFEKIHYKNNSFLFVDRRHIWKEQPDYSMDFGGLMVHYARSHSNIFSREEAEAYYALHGSGTPQQTFTQVLYGYGRDYFIQFAENRFVLTEALNINEEFLTAIRTQIEQLLEGDDYVAMGDIDDYFYSTLPSLPTGVVWGPLLLESVLDRNDIGFITIDAGDGNDMKTVDAALLRKNSQFRSFSDIVWNELSNDYELPITMTNEEFRLYLLNKGFIRGREKEYSVHKTVAKDLRFFWTEGNAEVTISK